MRLTTLQGAGNWINMHFEGKLTNLKTSEKARMIFGVGIEMRGTPKQSQKRQI